MLDAGQVAQVFPPRYHQRKVPCYFHPFDHGHAAVALAHREFDVARGAGRDLAVDVGFSIVETTQIATAISESLWT